jgi:DNA mismatch repair protein MutS
MQVDEQTLQDLEIRGRTIGAGLVDHLDRTRTRAGREALTRRLTRPLESTAGVRSVQSALQHIAGNRRDFDVLPRQARIEQLQRYLDSRFVTVARTSQPAAGFESVWIRLRHRDLYDEARRGLSYVRSFLTDLERLARKARTAPGPLEDLVDEIARLLETPLIAPLVEEVSPFSLPHVLLLRDRAARDAGRAPLLRMIALAGEVEALVAMSDATAELGYAYPTLVDDAVRLEIGGVYHPFLATPVRNDLRLESDQRLVFLTGPNMAGKTTYLKACGVAVLLAYTGMGVPAERCTIGTFDRLITAIRTEDSLRDGVSYFQAEARRVRAMVQPVAEGRRCLLIVDELFRGTNVKDACDATSTVLRTMAHAANGRLIVASHLTEVADQLAQQPGVVALHFAGALVDGTLSFDYRLRAGVSAQRLGMLVLEKEGVLQALAAIHAPPPDDATTPT